MTTAKREGALLIHGLGLQGQGVSMRPLARRLEAAGFRTVRIDYPAYRLCLAEAEVVLRARVAREASRFDTCHLVGHSLGGVLAARVFDAMPAGRRGRVVQLGSPNLGSPLALLAGRLPPVRGALGPALEELAAPLTPHPLWEAQPGVGAIAGRTGWGPAAYVPGPWTEGFREPSDGKVAVSSALAGASAKAILPVGHGFLPASRRVAAATIAYLREGAFPEAVRA
jgi:pimeloyl-ACP methyl ester carboxylesterase